MNTIDFAKWFGSILITMILAHVTLYRFAIGLNIKKYPKRIASIISIIITSIIGIAAYIVSGYHWYILIGTIMMGVGLLLALLWLLTRPTEEASIILVDLLDSLHKTDRQIAHIMGEIITSNGHENVNEAIKHAYRYIFSELEKALITDHTHTISITLLSLQNPNGKYDIVETHRVSPRREKRIRQKFSNGREGREVSNIVDAVIQRESEICISDLENPINHKDADLWVKIDDDDKKEGSLACIPLRKGSGPDKEIIGVLNIESTSKDAIDCNTIAQVKAYYLDKLEMLLYCGELNQRNARK